MFEGSGALCPSERFGQRLAAWLSQFDNPLLLADSDWDILVVRHALNGERNRRPGLLTLPGPEGPLEVMLLSLGVGIIVSSLTTKYRDLAIAVGFGVQLWMYASPVVYPLSMLDNSPRLRVLVQLNPMTSPIEIFRMATLGTGTVTTFGIVYSLIFTAAALVLGVVLFSRIEKTFMDTV